MRVARSLTHRNAFARRSRCQWRFDQERRARPSLERVMQRLQDEVGDGVEIRRFLHFEADPKISLRVVSRKSEAGERGDGARGQMAGPWLAGDIVVEPEAASQNIYVRGSKTHWT